MEYGAMFGGQRILKAIDNITNARQPFAASPVNVIDSIVLTQETNTSVVLAQWSAFDPSITVYSELRSGQAVRLFLNWSDQNGTIDLQQGDYFTFVIPDIFDYSFITNVNDVAITNPNDEVVATYSIYDNSDSMKEVRITFTDYVDNNTNIFGDFWMLLFVAAVDAKESKTIEFVINDNVVAEGQVTINPSTRYTPRNNKIGYSSPTTSAGGYYIFEWVVYFNMDENTDTGFNTFENFSFEDFIPENSPHIFLTNAIRQELGIPPNYYRATIGEYTGADSAPPENRYQVFLYHYNSTSTNIWYDFINWNTLANGLTTAGIGGDGGLNVSSVDVTDKLFSANLGTITRPTAIRFYTIATVKMTESALGDSEVAKLFRNTFRGSSGEDLSTSLTVYRFGAGGSAQGITGDYSFTFTKVNVNSVGLAGAMFSLFTSEDFAEGADRFAFSSAGGTVTFSHLPAGTYYLLETVAPFGYLPNNTIYRVVLSSGGFDIYYGDNFENRLSDNLIVNRSEFEVLPASVILTGTKNLTGRPLESGMFSFVVKDEDGDTIATGINNADGSIAFSSIAFAAPGIYGLTVEEVIGSSGGIIYDGTTFTVTVTVTDDGTGNLVAEVAYPVGGIVFNDSYIATPASVNLTGTKNLTGRPLESAMFSFLVKDEAGNTVATGINNSDGSITFGSIVFNVPGVYGFTVEEVVGSAGGIIYDGSIFTVTVTVTDDGNGNLAAEVAYPVGGIVFNDSYITTPASVTLTGAKNLTGRPLESGMFSFNVKDEAGNTVATGINNSDGSITFSDIVFTVPGVYGYTVEEVVGTSGGIIYDSSIFTVTVTVTDDGNGNLEAEVAYPVGGIVFNDSYIATPASVTLTGTKNLAGRPLENSMFSFLVKDEAGNTVASGINNSDGSITFSSIVFDVPGVYGFTVEEVIGSSSGILYDGSIFTVTVTVTDDGNGNLEAEVAYPVGGIVFNDIYIATSVPVALTGTKNLTGRLLESGMFSFLVKDEAGNTVSTGINNADGSITFSDILFDASGVYGFTVEEVIGSAGGIIYDGTTFTVTVTVTDDGTGNLAAEVAYPVGGIVFNDMYIATPASVTLTGTKNLTGRPLESAMFSFLVKDVAGNTIATGINNSDGSITFNSIVFDVPGVYGFTVEEVMGSAGGIIYDGSIFTVTVTVTDDGNGNLAAEVAYPVGGIVFNDIYIAIPASAALTGTKNLTGRLLESDMFSFLVKDEAGNTVATGINNADGSITFSDILFDASGVYGYTVEEVIGSAGGIIYDGSIFTVVVTVTDDGSGNLAAEVDYPVGGIVFNDSYVATPASVTLTGTKNLTGRPLENSMFSFLVKDEAGNTVASGINNADGSITFSGIVFDVPGVYGFTVEEVIGSSSGILYDGSIFTVTVTVTDDGNGNLEAEVAYPVGGIVFNDIYIATSVPVALTGTKNLTGRLLESGMFSFLVKDEAGNTVSTGINNADGSITFSDILFDASGVYGFTVEEVIGSSGGIIYDGSIFTVTVTVTDDGNGNLAAEVDYPVGGIVFNDSYIATPASVTLTGTKNLTGRPLEDGMFSFLVKDEAGNTIATGINNSDGSITFSSIVFDVPGVYGFTVEEVMGSSGGVIYDSSIFTVMVTVIDDGNGNLEAEVGYPVGGIVFNDIYIATSASVDLTGTKNLTGRLLESAMFSFLVKDEEGNTAAAGINNADGSITFSSIVFDAPGIFGFTVEEVMSSSSGIIYDGSIFAVTVTVTDDGNGNLAADVAYPVGGIVFNNIYIATSALVTLTGTKSLTGRSLESAMFSFVVKDEEGNTVAAGINNANGSIAFSSIVFDAPGTYGFTVEEVMGRSSGVIYDGSIFTVTVTVTDDGNGNLTAEVDYPAGGIVFNNIFIATYVLVTLTGTKNLTGRPLESGMFNFVVKDEEGNIVATGINNADGSITFSSIVFDVPGIYGFTVEEVMGSAGGIIYDGSIFAVTVTVTVTDDGSGNLAAEVAYPVGGIVFHNCYTIPPERPCPCIKQCCRLPCCQICFATCCNPCCITRFMSFHSRANNQSISKVYSKSYNTFCV